MKRKTVHFQDAKENSVKYIHVDPSFDIKSPESVKTARPMETAAPVEEVSKTVDRQSDHVKNMRIENAALKLELRSKKHYYDSELRIFSQFKKLSKEKQEKLEKETTELKQQVVTLTQELTAYKDIRKEDSSMQTDESFLNETGLCLEMTERVAKLKDRLIEADMHRIYLKTNTKQWELILQMSNTALDSILSDCKELSTHLAHEFGNAIQDNIAPKHVTVAYHLLEVFTMEVEKEKLLNEMLFEKMKAVELKNQLFMEQMAKENVKPLSQCRPNGKSTIVHIFNFSKKNKKL